MRKIVFFLLICLLAVLVKAQDRLILPEVREPVVLAPVDTPTIASVLMFPQAPDKEIKIGIKEFKGLNLFLPVDQSQCIEMTNFVSEGLFSFKRRYGYDNINDTTHGAINGMILADSGWVLSKLVVVCDDSIFWTDSSSNYELIDATALAVTTDTATYFTLTNDGVIITNGVDTVKYWTDSTFVVLPSGASTVFPTGEAAAFFKSRYFVSRESKSTWVQYSLADATRKFQAADRLELSMGKDDYAVAMRAFNNHLIIFGKHSIHGVDASLNIYILTKSFGCVAPHTIAIGDNYVYWLTELGIYRFTGNIYGSFSHAFEKISDPIQDIIESIDIDYLPKCGGLYTDKQYWFSYHSDTCLVFDERTGFWSKQTFGFTYAVTYPGVLYDENLFATRFLFAEADSEYFFKYSDAYTDNNGTAYTSTYQSGWFNGGLPVNQKQMREFTIDLEMDAGDLKVYYYEDFGTIPVDTFTITLASAGKKSVLDRLQPLVAGRVFGIKIETTANIDTLIVKGWSALLRDLGQRKN